MDTRQKNPRRRKAAYAGNKRKAEGKQKPAPEPVVKASADVVYMAPKPFSRNRLLLRLATVAAVVLALFLGVSVFFKVESITVSGNRKYTPWDISSASGIEIGGNLLTFSRAKASGKIIAALPYVESVRIGIKLPNTVMIDIAEVEVTYGIKAQDDSWWLLSSSGKVIENSQQESECTKLLGVTIVQPVQGENAVALEEPARTDPDGNTLPVTVTGESRLNTALDIAQYLERNGIIGGAASIDVTSMADLVVWYGQQYQVKLGNGTQLDYKISCMKNVIDNMQSYAGGVVDITDPEHIAYEPF